jgi:hypothetical protein
MRHRDASDMLKVGLWGSMPRGLIHTFQVLIQHKNDVLYVLRTPVLHAFNALFADGDIITA